MQPQDGSSPPAVRALIESTGTPFAAARYSTRAVIFSQGDACDSVMHIESGRVRLAVTAPSGKEAICGLLGPGAFLGEDVLGGDVVRRHTATAMTPTEVLVVAGADMVRLLRTQHALSGRFIAHMLARKTRLEIDLTDQLLYSSEQRLAHTLLVLAGCHERRPCPYALPDVSQEMLGEMVGTTRARVNVFIANFKKLGFLVQKHGVLQVNPSLLHLVDDACRDISGDASPDPRGDHVNGCDPPHGRSDVGAPDVCTRAPSRSRTGRHGMSGVYKKVQRGHGKWS